MFNKGDQIRIYDTNQVMKVRAEDNGWLLLDIGWVPARKCELIVPAPTPEPVSSIPFAIGDRVTPTTQESREIFGYLKTGRVTGVNDETQELIVLRGREYIRVPASLVRKIPTAPKSVIVNAR